MEQKVVFGVAGRIGSGKTVVAAYLAGAYGAEQYALPPPDRRDELIRRIQASEARVHVVRGIRTQEDIGAFAQAFGERFFFLYVDADPKKCLRRVYLQSQEEGRVPLTRGDFLRAYFSREEERLHELKAVAGERVIAPDGTRLAILNNGTLKALEGRLDDIYRKALVLADLPPARTRSAG